MKKAISSIGAAITITFSAFTANEMALNIVDANLVSAAPQDREPALSLSSTNQLRFDFESGDLQGWKVVEGNYARAVTDRASYHNGGLYASRQGKFHLSTVEGINDTSADSQRGVIESPVFVLDGPDLSFLVGGGNHPDTYVALCTLDGKEQVKACGRDSEVMVLSHWTLPQLVGQKVFLRVFDGNEGGWGHVTLDDVVAAGHVDPLATKDQFARRKKLLGGNTSPAVPDALRHAIEDLMATFGDRYVGGKAFLKELEDLQSKDGSGDQGGLAEKLVELQKKALLANPLIIDHEILYVARPQYISPYHAIDTLSQVGEATDGRFTPGGALKALKVGTGETRTLVAMPQGTVRSPCIHFDGKKIIFAMRQDRKENYHLFEINADGSGLKQLTFAPGVSDFDPFYLPDGGIAFSSTREPKFNMCSQDLGANLFRMDADGANIHQITKSTLFENQGALMPDGRILYSRWEYVDRNFGDAHGFWTVNPDGTQQSILWGNNKADPAAVYYPRVIPGTSTLLCILSTHHGNMWGALALINPRVDIDRNASILRTWPASVRTTLRDDDAFVCDRLGGVNPKYEDPFPLSDKYFLCSRSESKGKMGIYLLDVFGNELLVRSEDPGCFSAMPLAATPRPPTLRTRRNYENGLATMYVANVYEGTHMKGVTHGVVKKLRIVEAPEKRGWSDGKWFGQGFQAPGMNWSDFTAKRILGTVPVEADGSAYFQVPSDKFIYFQLLDENGMMIQSMRSGTVAQSGERVGCIGCHDDRLAVKAPHAPTLAQAREPSVIEPWYGPARSFGFMAEVQPVLNKYCVECHDFGKPAGKKLLLAGDRDPYFNAAYTELWRKGYIAAIGAGPAGIRQAYSWGSHPSRLVKVLREGHPAGSGGPGLDKLKLDRESFDRIVTWIDINAPYYSTYYTSYPNHDGGRSPLDGGQLHRLGQLTGVNWGQEHTYTSSKGPWVSFDRPELSPCLAKLDKTSPEYKEALSLIQVGKEALANHPRGDAAEFIPCEKDRQREEFYQQRVQVELANRAAIREGRKLYEERTAPGQP